MTVLRVRLFIYLCKLQFAGHLHLCCSQCQAQLFGLYCSRGILFVRFHLLLRFVLSHEDFDFINYLNDKEIFEVNIHEYHGYSMKFLFFYFLTLNS